MISNSVNHALAKIAVLCLLTATAVAQNKSEELKQRILAQAKNLGPDDYCFTRTIRTEQTSNQKTERKVLVEKFDPTKPAGERWALISADGGTPSADLTNQFRREAAKRRVVPGYHRLANYFGAPAAASVDSDGRTIFRFSHLPKETIRVLDTDVSENASADVSIGEANGTPFAEKIRITVKPMRLKLIAKLNSYESTARYRMGPEGKPLLVEQTSDMSGSGMGQEGRGHTVITYGEYRVVSQKP